MRLTILLVSFFFTLTFAVVPATAQTLTTSNVQIDWSVVNRFRLFREAQDFKTHELAWRQYRIHVDNLGKSRDEAQRLLEQTSVIGTEHVLNDRFIPFTRILRKKHDWRGWAARQKDTLCWDAKTQGHTACGGVDAYLNPATHGVEVRLAPLQKGLLLTEYNCEWRVGSDVAISAPCDEPQVLSIPFPAGANVFVSIPGEQPVSQFIKVKDLVIAGLGDSFASGEGNPDMPVIMTGERRSRNILPGRLKNDASGNAQWMDEACHRSLYGHQLRTALQVAIENPRIAVAFLGYSCSGASVDEGVLGPQTYVEYVSDGSDSGTPQIRSLKGGRRDVQMYRLLRDLCLEKPEQDDGFWTCPNKKFRRPVDFVLLSVGGNDIGFSNLVAWATLRANVTSTIARFLGATVSADQFGENMRDMLPRSYARLAKAIETGIPMRAGELGFDPSRVVLSAYPDILADETGAVCGAGSEDENESGFPANNSLNAFSSWLVVTDVKLRAAHGRLEKLHARMGELAEDHGWIFAGRAYADRAFRGHGFCAQDRSRQADPAEALAIPCWSQPGTPVNICESRFNGGDRAWQPFDPGAENFPYALRQRWVRTFNDVFLVLNQKVLTKDGRIDERASAAVFAETTGAMHPTAEGHAAMADAIMVDLRQSVEQILSSTNE